MSQQLQLSHLSHNERLVLALWACCQSIKETAKYMKLSERTIDYYRGRLKCRFNALSSNEVITKLMARDDYEGLIRFGRNYLLENNLLKIA